jgi:hypothetical protein
VDKDMKKIRYVVGKVEGPLNLADDEKVIFAGSCTSWKGRIRNEDVTIESGYKTAGEVDETRTRTNDMLYKTFSTLFKSFLNRNANYLHAKGCTLSVAEHVHYLSALAKVKNPVFDPRLSVLLTITYWQMRIKRFFNRLVGV